MSSFNQTDASPFAIHGEEGEIDNAERRWEALARSCLHESISVREAARSGASMFSQFAILLIGPISIGSLIVLFSDGTNSARFAAVSSEAREAREVVAVPGMLIPSSDSVDEQQIIASASIPDLVPRFRRMTVPALPSDDENASRTDAPAVEEIVIMVPPRKPGPSSRLIPNPPVLSVEGGHLVPVDEGGAR